jgi:sphinganine-1-phosphate aldolase
VGGGPHRRGHGGHHRIGLQLRLRHDRPDRRLSDIALEHGVGLHVDGCLGGFILPFGQELGYDIPVFDYRVPGVTSISADTHKYGYALKGTSVLTFRDKALRNAQYFFLTDWSGGKYCSPGMEGSRSGGLIAATWASMVQLGREGYLRYAKEIFETAGHARRGRSHPELRILGSRPSCSASRRTSSTSTTSTTSCEDVGWRFNGQQYPNALHMAVTRPQTQPGVTEPSPPTWTPPSPTPRPRRRSRKSGAIYGGVAGGMTDEADEFIKMVMADMMDGQQAIPAET